MSIADALTGHLRWQLHADAPLLINERPDWVSRVALGRPAQELPGVLAALFSMCANAHRLTATQAVQAAMGQAQPGSPEQQTALQTETLREHLRRLWLEWPRLLWDAQAPAPVASQLAQCPVLRPERRSLGPAAHGAVAVLTSSASSAAATQERLAELRIWLHQHVFGVSPADWLCAWQAEGEAALSRWADLAGTWPAQMLKRVRPVAQPMRLPCRPLRIDVPDASLPAHAAAQPGAWQGLADWAAEQARVAGANREPLWQQLTAETGPWTRMHGADAQGCAALPSLWWRMGARLADIARLALPDDAACCTGRHALQTGALSLAEHTAVAWTETARGLLMHWVRLDAAQAASGALPKVAACQVVSPTEWNFHVRGEAARALHAPRCLTLDDHLRLIPVLLAAYDPCVPVQVVACDGSLLMRHPAQPSDRPTPQEATCTN